MGIVQAVVTTLRGLDRVVRPHNLVEQRLAKLDKLNNLRSTQLQGPLYKRFLIPGTNMPGGVLLSRQQDPAIKTVYIGDKHANRKNFYGVVAKYLPELRAGTVQLVFLGDFVQPARGTSKELKDMTDSIEILHELIDLMLAFPDNVHLLRGDHENLFDADLRKGGFVFQSLEMREALKKGLPEELGRRYVATVQAFFEGLPNFMITAGAYGFTLAGHTPIVKGGVDLEKLIASPLEIDNPNHRSPYVFSRPVAAVSDDPLLYNDTDVTKTLTGIFIDGFRRLGLKRPLSQDELQQIVVVSGHHDDGSAKTWFSIEGFRDELVFLQSFLTDEDNSFSLLEVSEGGRVKPVPVFPQASLPQLQ